MTKIEWAEEVWNPTIGCSLIAPGCKNCYAMRDAYRKQFHPNPKISEAYAGLTQLTNGHPVWTGKVNLMEERLSIPLRKRKPTTWFVDSMSDLFHADVPEWFIDRVFAVMSLCPQHRFIILTKRPERMANYLEDIAGPLSNVIIGSSASDQATLDAAAPHLMRTPAACRVLSLEPLLGPVTSIPKVDWVIVGGESGPDARPCNVQWIRDIVYQCANAGVMCFVKQLGAKPQRPLSIAAALELNSFAGRNNDQLEPMRLEDRKGGDMAEWREDIRVRQLPEVLR